MARHVRISSIPAAQLAVNDTRDYEGCVQQEMAYWQGLINKVLPDHPDLIVTPECCDRPAGLSNEEKLKYYEVRGDRMRDFFSDIAKNNRVNIAYAAVRRLPDGTGRNSIQMINRAGGIDGIYNKNVLVIEEYTRQNSLYGRSSKAIKTDFGRVCGAICFDLNFEQPLKASVREKPDLILFSSAYHGGIMQAHWAYMCRAYFVSCIFGTETASIINPVGEVVAQSSNYYKHLTATVNLDCKVAHLDYNWAKFEAMKKKYGELVEMSTPYGLGATLLTCNDATLTMDEIVREFEIELWDDYYARAMAARELPGRMED